MHIDWFIVVILAVAILFGWWSSWLAVKGRREKRGRAERSEAQRSAKP